MKKFLLSLVALAFAINLPAIDRGLGNPKSLYIEKGTFAAGITGSYFNLSAKDGINLFGLLSGTDGGLSLLSAEAHADWFLKDNLALIVSAGYSNTGLDVESVNLAGMLPFSNKHIKRENYEASLGVRQYIPLFDSKILAFFAEGRLTGSRGYSKSYALTDRGKEGDYTDLYSVDLGMIVGVSVFVTDRMAVQISLPKLSFGMEWEKQLEAQVRESSMRSLNASTSLDLLGLQVGTIFCF